MNVIINGCNGRMGKELAQAIKETPGVETIGGIDQVDTGDNSFPVYTNLDDIKDTPDVIIDFSIPTATMKLLEYTSSKRIPTVIATTGFSPEELSQITEYSKTIPIFRSANMSYEVTLMSRIVAEIAKALPESDIEIVETHHHNKIDAPSGTALLLANSINDACDNKFDYEYNRHDKREKRPANQIGIHSIRGGTEVGTHSVIFFGNNESFEVKHTCTSRKAFAFGAIKAAQFLSMKEPGLYNMNDIK